MSKRADHADWYYEESQFDHDIICTDPIKTFIRTDLKTGFRQKIVISDSGSLRYKIQNGQLEYIYDYIFPTIYLINESGNQFSRRERLKIWDEVHKTLEISN